MQKKIIVIGGGPGGYVAAIRGAQLGAKVVLIGNTKSAAHALIMVVSQQKHCIEML